jgi:hypothetical protein
VQFHAVPQRDLPKGAHAEYFSRGESRAGEAIAWDEFFHEKTETIPVRISEELLKTDEGAVAVIGHEMHELNALRRIYESRNYADLPAEELHRLISPGIAGNLHDQAWEIADALVRSMRSGK